MAYLSSPSDASAIFTDLHGVQSIKQAGDDDAALKKVAQQFESMFVHMMLKSMRNANAAFEEDSLFQSESSKFYRDMYDQQLALTMSSGKGIGIAEAMYQQMRREYGVQNQNPDIAKDPLKIDDVRKHAENSVIFDLRFANTPDKPPPPREQGSFSVVDSATIRGNERIDTAQKFGAVSPEDFINKVRPFAHSAAIGLGVDVDMLVAQAALETGWGRFVSRDSTGGTSNNLFNIKADARWQGEKVSVDTLEYRDGIAQKETANFRKYLTIRQSFEDFAGFIQNNSRYKQALDLAADAKQFIKAIHKSGYATDPQYSDKVISIFNRIKNGDYNPIKSSGTGDL